MKKKYLFLLTIPVLCLCSCNKPTATRTIYRDNFTKRDVYSGDALVSSTTSTYDEYGLPLEIKQTVNPVWGSNLKPEKTIKTYNRAFDDKHREIKLEEKVTILTIDETVKPYGDYRPLDTSTIITREYDDSGFLTKENYKEFTSSETKTSTKIAHKATNKDGYLIFTLLAGRSSARSRDSSHTKKAPDIVTMSFSVVSYDKQDRKTGTFSFSTTRSSFNSLEENATRAKDLSSSLVLSNTNYQSDNNDTNDFYEYTYQQISDDSSIGSTNVKSLASGHETYSDKNLLIERHEEKVSRRRLILNNQEFFRDYYTNHNSSTDETWQYDDFNRLIFNESKVAFYNSDGKKVAWDNLKFTYSYANNDDQEPSKIISHSDKKDNLGEIITIDLTALCDFDDYGRVKAFNSEKKETSESTKSKVTNITKEKIVSDYADPIAIPEDEELISIPRTKSAEVSLVHCDFIE